MGIQNGATASTIFVENDPEMVRRRQGEEGKVSLFATGEVKFLDKIYN
jgi:hypothetical protein